eukprot:1841611-Pleurochrysis_carterae.AAC.1
MRMCAWACACERGCARVRAHARVGMILRVGVGVNARAHRVDWFLSCSTEPRAMVRPSWRSSTPAEA